MKFCRQLAVFGFTWLSGALGVSAQSGAVPPSLSVTAAVAPLPPVAPVGSVQAITAPQLYGISGGGTVELGQPVTLTASSYETVDGWSFVWKKDDAIIAGASAQTYGIAAATAAHAGTYTVSVTNAAGTSVASTALAVKPAAAPVITSGPRAVVAEVGQPALFRYTATGSYPRTHQWRKNGGDIPGATGAFYQIDVLGTSDAGTYSVVVSNSLGSATSAAASLTVNAAKPVTISADSPYDRSATVGSPVEFSVYLDSGSSPYAYQWRKGGVPIPGATAARLELAIVTLADAGRYSVVVTNAAGSATSREAILTVTPATPVVFTTQPQSVSVYEGGDASFYVYTSNGSPPVKLQWMKNGTAISGANSSGISSNYSIRKVALGDAGNYTVVATNPAGSVTSATAVLTVKAAIAPAISRQPSALTIAFGGSLGLSVEATGSPPLYYQWQRNGIDINGANSSYYNVWEANTTHSGVYTVLVSNPGGSVTSANAAVTVKPAALPSITKQPAAAAVAVGLRALFSVEYDASGAGRTTFQWQKDGVSIPGATNASYSIDAVQTSDSGLYTLVITATAGSVTSSAAKLTVLSAARPVAVSWPYDVTETEGGNAYFSVRVEGSPPFSYQWFKSGTLIEGATSASLEIRNVTVADAGDYTVHVSNAGGVIASTPARLKVRTASDTAPWMDAVRLGDIVYFLATSPSRIERYDLAAERWLPRVVLSESRVPTAFLPLTEGVYIAYGRMLARRPLDLSTETTLLNVLADITRLHAYDDFLFYNTSGSGSSFSHAVLKRSTLTAGANNVYDFANAVFSARQRRGYVTGGYYSRIPEIVAIDAEGKFTRENSVGDLDDLPTGARLFLFPGESHIANNGGAIFRTADLAYAGSFGEPLDDLVFLASGTPVALRQRTLETYSSDRFLEAGRVTLPFAGVRAFATGNNVFVFGAAEFAGGQFSVNKTVSTAYSVPVLPTVTSGAGEQFSIDEIFCSPTGVVHVLSRSKRAMLRWSASAKSYLTAIPLRAAPRMTNIVHGLGTRAILVYVDGVITEVPFSETGMTERQIGTVGNRVWGITDMGDKLMLNIYNYGSSADRRLVLSARGEPLYLSGWSYWGEGLAYAPATRRLYTEGRFSIASMEYETVPDSGILPAGTNSVSNPVKNVEPPLCLSPDGALIAAGNGRVVNADLIGVGALANDISDAAWLSNGLYTMRTVDGEAEIQQWSRINYLLIRSVKIPGVPLRLFRLSDTQFVVVTIRNGAPAFTILKDDLTGSSETPVNPVKITTQSPSQAVTLSQPVTLSVLQSGGTGTLSYAWFRDGNALQGVAGSTLTIGNFQPVSSGIYSAVITAGNGSITSAPIIAGGTTMSKVAGTGTEVGPDIKHPNGRTFDQVLLEGAAASITADAEQVTRISYVDLDDDIVQVEFTGAGTLSIVLSGYSDPAPPAKYVQPGNRYMKGHASLVVTGANETTHLSVFSVGRANAVNQSLFRDDTWYDGVADIGYIAILSSNGRFGGLRCGNTSFFAAKGITGLYAPGVKFTGPVYINDISAFDDAAPMLVMDSADGDTLITGGSLFQDNGRPVEVHGLTQLKFVTGSTSHGFERSAQRNRARLEQNGVDVTAQIVVNP